MGRRRSICCLAAALALLAIALPASASAAGRITLCLQGKQACSGASKIAVPAPVSDVVAPLIVGEPNAPTLEAALDICARTVGDQLSRDLPGQGIDAEICRSDGHWAFGWSYTTRVANAAKAYCAFPRGDEVTTYYRACELETASPSGPYVLIENDQNWPYPITPGE